jgi:hypothetical protein
MQERPNKQALLSAIARFLVEDARPALADPRLAFRALIAANLASIVASELASDADAIGRELERLRPLVQGAPEAAASLEGRREQVSTLTAKLAARLREETLDDAELSRVAAALRESLREKLAIDNPRFDLSPDVE